MRSLATRNVWSVSVLAATLVLWIPKGVLAGARAVLVTQSGKEFVCNDIQQDNGWVLKARTQHAKIEVPFEKIEKIVFKSCQARACYIFVEHKTEGEVKAMIPFDEAATIRCVADPGTGTFTGKQISEIKEIRFLE